MNNTKDPLKMSEKEYKEWFLKKFRKERKERKGVGGMFEAIIGTGEQHFINSVENMMVTSSIAARNMAINLDKKAETPEGRMDILSALRSSLNTKKQNTESSEEDG